MTVNKDLSPNFSEGERGEHAGEVLLGQALGLAEYGLNHLRMTYLLAIQGSSTHRVSPAQAVSHRFNGAFWLMSGVGGELAHLSRASEVNAYLMDMGFEPAAWVDLDWSHGKSCLSQALAALRRAPCAPGQVLAELYSLKPGFHEAWLHDEYPHDVLEDLDRPLGRVFAVNRGLRDEVMTPSPEEFERLIEVKAFLAYAACAITEGPLVRRRAGVDSYANALRSIGPESSLIARQRRLQESFEVRDTWRYLRDRNAERGLQSLVEATSAFVGPPPRCLVKSSIRGKATIRS
jgi:hypothetical protein